MSFDKSEALRKAEQHALKGEISAAITVYRKIVETDPYDFSSINKLGDLYISAGKVKEAVKEFSSIADLHLTGGSATRAAYLLKKTLELDPSNAPVRMKLGEVYSRENMTESAHEAFVLAGSAFMRSGDIDKAIEANQKALAVKPDSQQAKAAIATLENEAALNKSKHTDAQAKPGGSDPVSTSDAASQGVKRKQGAGSMDHLLSGYDDDFVVRRISKAEALVGFGEVSQAVSMLKEVLHSAPDNIAIHIKLKDIYLRAEMMSEACVEYKELARIYTARGETSRAKDYEVRAQRLSRMIAQSAPQPDAQASTSTKKIELQPVISNSNGSSNDKGSASRKAADDIHAAIDETTRTSKKVAAVTLQASVMKAEVEHEKLDELFNSEGKLNLQAEETALISMDRSEQAMTTAPALVSSSSFPAASILGLTLVDTNARSTVERKRMKRLYATLTTFFCLTAIVVSVVTGYWIYDARLNRQYKELIRASSLNSLPERPQTPAFEESENFEEAQNADNDVVTLGPQPAQVVKSSESGLDQPEIYNAAPKLNAEPKAAPAITSESPGVNKPRALSPPLVAPALDNRAGVDGNSPKEMSARVPEHPTEAAPMPAQPGRASVTIPGEVLRRVQPKYPDLARNARQGGTVSVEVVISENGDVISARAISGSDLLRNAAVLAAKGWKFKPSTRDGKRVKSTTTLSFNFKL